MPDPAPRKTPDGPEGPVPGGNPGRGRRVRPRTLKTCPPGPLRPVRPGNRDIRPGSAAETENFIDDA